MTLRILIADDEEAARFGMVRALTRPGREILEAADGRLALEVLRERAPHLALLDLDMPGLDGRSVLRELAALDPRPETEVVVVTANDSLEAAVECMRLGATDYLTKPFEVERLRALARRQEERLALEGKILELRAELEGKQSLGCLVGRSAAMVQLYTQIQKAARAQVPILIRGETGTGKELLARELHRLGARPNGPFVAVNTAAIAESLAESELFGHVKGAFTGAAQDRAGVFEQADRGTIFLDEIGDMPLQAQAKILRVLQERVLQRVGSTRPQPVDVRVIAATHQDLEHAIKEGRFRQDLYYRLRGVELQIPPLRHRPDDIVCLAEHFLALEAQTSGTPPRRLSLEALRKLLQHRWPGNVRELEQVIRGASAMVEGEEIQAGAIALGGVDSLEARELALESYLDLPLSEGKARLVETYERAAITRALRATGGNVSAAARQLGVHRQSLQQLMAQLGISREA